MGFCICKFGATDKYNDAIKRIAVLDNVGYIYLAAFLFSITVWFLNMFPASRFKPLVMGGDAGNFRVNMNIFKVNAVDGEPLTDKFRRERAKFHVELAADGGDHALPGLRTHGHL